MAATQRVEACRHDLGKNGLLMAEARGETRQLLK